MPNKELQTFPYQNMKTTSLKKEIWKEIPGFEGSYHISNFGRVKSLARIITGRWGEYPIDEKILKLKLDIKKTKGKNLKLYSLLVGLNTEGNSHAISIGRMVYYVFVEKFNLKDRRVLIGYKDKDGRNCHVSNLKKTNSRELRLESLKLKRLADPDSLVPVTCFDQEGKPYKKFKSISEAAKKMKILASNIGAVIHGDYLMYKGYFWKKGLHDTPLNLDKLLSQDKSKSFINENLKARLGIKKINPLNPPPFLNLSTQTMPGEKWKDFPGYEGLYMVSNLGRVKTLKKITSGKQQKWKPERIISIVVDFRKDEKGKEIAGNTLVTLSKDNKKKTYSIARYVYYLFVKKFDLNNLALRIYYKDGVTVHNDAKNLMLKKALWSFHE